MFFFKVRPRVNPRLTLEADNDDYWDMERDRALQAPALSTPFVVDSAKFRAFYYGHLGNPNAKPPRNSNGENRYKRRRMRLRRRTRIEREQERAMIAAGEGD